MPAILIDTETTGINEPDVIQLAHTQLMTSPFDIPLLTLRSFKPSKPIDLGALATHHILEEELIGCEPWPGRWAPPEGATYLCGHGVDFDWKAIGSPDVKRICTLALSRATWPEIDSHTLSAMTYFLNDHREARGRLRNAHSAGVDVHLCYQLLHRIINATGAKTWDELYVASEKARVPIFLSFGKYGPHEVWAKSNGGPMRCAEVRRMDPGYYSWLMSKCDQVRDDPYLAKALRGEAA